MKRTTTILGISAALFSLFTAAAPSADMTGVWVTEPASGRDRIYSGNRIEISHSGSEFAFKRWDIIGTETLMADVTCVIGGGPCKVAYENLQNNGRVTKYEWKAYMEGDKIIAELYAEWSGDTPKSQKYIHGLTPDGQSLTVEYLYTSLDGNGPTTMVDLRGAGRPYTRQ